MKTATTKKKAAPRRSKEAAADPDLDNVLVTLTPAGVDMAVRGRLARQARQRAQLVAWWARIMTEIEVVRDSLQRGSVSKWDGILTDGEQLTLDCKLDHVWSLLANAIPKATPPEMADVIADVEARDRER